MVGGQGRPTVGSGGGGPNRAAVCAVAALWPATARAAAAEPLVMPLRERACRCVALEHAPSIAGNARTDTRIVGVHVIRTVGRETLTQLTTRRQRPVRAEAHTVALNLLYCSFIVLVGRYSKTADVDDREIG